MTNNTTTMKDVMQEVWNEVDREEKERKIPVDWIPKKTILRAEQTKPIDMERILGKKIDETPVQIFKDEDVVNHPSHYCQEGSMECIDEMIEIFGIKYVMAFCLCNVWKYRKRAIYKNGVEDLKKSDWYVAKYIELKTRLKNEQE